MCEKKPEDFLGLGFETGPLEFSLSRLDDSLEDVNREFQVSSPEPFARHFHKETAMNAGLGFGLRRDPGEHDRMVGAVARWLRGQDAGARADVDGFDQPAKIFWHKTGDGHIPDATGAGYVVEVETADTLDTEHTKAQCQLFSAYATEHGLKFAVGVPKGSKHTMDLYLLAWGLTGVVWEL